MVTRDVKPRRLRHLVVHRETGLLLEADDVPAAARLLRALLADVARGWEIGEAGRRGVAAGFTIGGSARPHDLFHGP